MFKKTTNPKITQLTKSTTKRSVCLDQLKPVKTEAGRFCAWCVEGQIHRGNAKYCNQVCRDSAWAWAYPQSEHGLGMLLHRQDHKCNLCGFDYNPFLETECREMHGGYSYNRLIDYKTEFIWYLYSRLKRRVPPERKPEVDHVIPIFKGGESLGLDNHQAICYSCHKSKTAKDLSKCTNPQT